MPRVHLSRPVTRSPLLRTPLSSSHRHDHRFRRVAGIAGLSGNPNSHFGSRLPPAPFQTTARDPHGYIGATRTIRVGGATSALTRSERELAPSSAPQPNGPY